MATTYGDIANKLSKKLGEYEKVLETSTEPTEIETAKRSIERIQQAMALLKASQQNHPEAQSLEEQGMEQGMMAQGMPMQEQQMPQQGMPQQQMAMPQQQMQQQMPQQQQMGYAQTGGYLPAYQASSGAVENAFVGMGGGEVSLPSGERGTMSAEGSFTPKNKIDMEGALNAGLYGAGVAGSMAKSSSY